jgi:hypothetical protein
MEKNIKRNTLSFIFGKGILRFIYKKQINMEVDEMLISLENIYLLVYYSDKYVQSLRNTDKVYNYI